MRSNNAALSLLRRQCNSALIGETMRCQISKLSMHQREQAGAPASLSKRQALNQVARMLTAGCPARISHCAIAKKEERRKSRCERSVSCERIEDVEERDQPAQVSAANSDAEDARSEGCYSSDSSCSDDSSSSSSSSSNATPNVEMSLICSYEEEEEEDPILKGIAEISFDSAADGLDDDEVSVLSSYEATSVDDFDSAIFEGIHDPFPDVEVDVDFRPLP